MLALGLLRSPVARYIGIAIAFAGFLGWQRHDAASGAREEVVANVEAEAQAERFRRGKIYNDALEHANSQAAARQAELEAMKRELANASQDSGCVIPDDLSERLSRIR